MFTHFIINNIKSIHLICKNKNISKYFVLFGQDASLESDWATQGVQGGGIAVGLTLPAENARQSTELKFRTHALVIRVSVSKQFYIYRVFFK